MAVLTLKEAKSKLVDAYQSQRLIPFLGAGFSAPLRLPGWSELMQWMGEPLGFDPAVFELQGMPWQQAGYYELEKGSLDPFIAQMRRRFHAPKANALRRKSAQHRALAQLDVRRIYTTNFEHHVERALRDAGKKVEALVRLEDFAKPRRHDACQVVKFHGDLEHPDTVVLTERQFFERFRLEAAPDQCLRADLLGHVFLFVGYSFSDINIRYIWYRMDRLRREGSPTHTRPRHDLRSYWATFGTGHLQPRLLDAWHIDVIALDPRDKSGSVAELLDAISGGPS